MNDGFEDFLNAQPNLALASMASSAGIARMSSSCFYRLDIRIRKINLVDDRENKGLLEAK